MNRPTLNPQTVRSEGKLKLLNGMANSATQPSAVRRVRTSQMASHSLLDRPLAKASPSTSAPAGFVEKKKGVEDNLEAVVGVQGGITPHLRAEDLVRLRVVAHDADVEVVVVVQEGHLRAFGGRLAG